MALKQKKWYNFGDVNFREYGGNFVKIDGDEVIVVKTDNNKESGVRGGIGYMFYSITESVKELTERFEAFKNGTKDEVGNFADWTIFTDKDGKGNGWDMDEIVCHMASDIISYYGDDLMEFNTNYWEGLGYHGIKPYMFRNK